MQLSPALLHVILNIAPTKHIEVGTCSVSDLFSFKTTYTIAIPEYQRPYVWQTEQVEKLLQDLRDFTSVGKSPKEQDENEPHYLGTILLHRKGDVYNLIDGQQRITSLLLINSVICPEHSIIERYREYLNLFYEAPISKVNIARNYQFIMERVKRYLDPKRFKKLFDHLTLTVIITDRADDAFNFFVSQNNTGVILGATDFLKSFHLRSLRNHPDLQRMLAKSFDKSNYDKYLDRLFTSVLWRGRKWRGKEVAYDEPGEIRAEFEEGSIKGQPDELKFYPGRNHSLDAKLVRTENELSVKTEDLNRGYSGMNLPFSLRQPVEEGTGFFLYTEKYAKLMAYLFDGSIRNEGDLGKMRSFYRMVYQEGRMSSYLKSLFRLCIVFYYDQFGPDQLYSFTLWLDYFIGSYRVVQKSIVAQTPVKICRDKSQNILDIIASSFLPSEIFQYLKNNTQSENYKTSIISTDKGVQADYIRCLRAYYEKQDTDLLINKIDWIYDRL